MKKLSETLIPPEVFEATMNYFLVRKGGRTKEIVHAYYVLGLPTTTITERFDCSKQNVIKAVARFADAYHRYESAKRNVGRSSVPAVASNDPAPAKRKALKVVPAKTKAPAKKAAARK